MESEHAASPLNDGEHAMDARRQAEVNSDRLQAAQDIQEMAAPRLGMRGTYVGRSDISPFESREAFGYAVAGDVNTGFAYMSSGDVSVPAGDLAA